MGVTNIVTFDVHNIGIQNAVPLIGFDNVQPTYQMIKALVKTVPDIQLDKDHLMMISPDEGGMTRCMYYSSMLSLDLGMFYKRRDYTQVVNGKNPIVAHEYLGRSVKDKDVIIVDDIISSGQSILDVATMLKARGAKRIFAFASFGLFCEGLESIDKAYADGILNKIFTTNLIYRSPELLAREWYTEVDLGKYVALIIDTLNRDETISHLLKPAERIKTLVEKVKDGGNK
ncbi:MAG: ribose-phosphate diphosphokinase, partial [Clostridia bacterium]|nr:ribose-phosphate diphosphokinase [Clostridia bacterium]